VVDDGAAQALRQGGSLLPVGLRKIEVPLNVEIRSESFNNLGVK